MENITLRIKFTKFGPIKFIGHLDVMRYFQKAIRRAGLDIKYTNGFNPHQIMSFAAPLSVGVESMGEYMDIEMNSIISTDDVKLRLNQCMAEGIEIVDVSVLPDNSKNAMASVTAAIYSVVFRDSYSLDFSLKKAVDKFNNANEVNIQKQSKKSDAVIDLKPAVYELNADDDKRMVTMKVNASSSGNIKPLYVVQSLCEMYRKEVCFEDLMITRLDTILEG